MIKNVQSSSSCLLVDVICPTKCRIRKENLSRAIEHESNGNSAAAYECYQKAVDISPSIAHELIQVGMIFYGDRFLIFYALSLIHI